MVIEGIDLCKVYMRRFMLLCIFCLSAGVCSGNVQKFGVTGTVVAADTGLPLDYASVVVANNETSLMYFIQTDTLGRFTLSVGKGSYFVEVSYTGYEKQRYMMEVIADTNVMVKLEVASEQLAAAIVESSRIEHDLSGYRMGNISKNVRLTSLPLADILQTAPGVWAVQGENVSIYGRAATIYIDNREVTIPANALTDYLNTFSGRDVKSIEVITNPGGEYASGNPVIKITTEIEEGGRLLAQAGYTGLSDYTNESHAFALDISTTFMIKGVFNVNGTLKYRSDAISGLNLQENSPVQANVTVNRNFLKNRLRVSLGCADVFNSNKLKKKRVALANGMMREIRNNIGSRCLLTSSTCHPEIIFE